MERQHAASPIDSSSWGRPLTESDYATLDSSWITREIRPAENLMDAFQLLEAAAPDEYSMTGSKDRVFRVRVRLGRSTGEATGKLKPLVITCAIARALGVEIAESLAGIG